MSIFTVKSPRRIANKIILLVLALVLFSIMLWGSLIYIGSRDELIRTKTDQLNEVAFNTSNEIGKFFIPIFVEADVISSVIASISFIGAGPKFLSICLQCLASYL